MFTVCALALSAVLILLSLLFKLAGKLKLTLPFVYFLLVSTVLNPWAAQHEHLALAILFLLLLVSLVSWIRALRKKIWTHRFYKALSEDIAWQAQQARHKGIDLKTVYFDCDGNMRDHTTGKIIQ